MRSQTWILVSFVMGFVRLHFFVPTIVRCGQFAQFNLDFFSGITSYCISLGVVCLDIKWQKHVFWVMLYFLLLLHILLLHNFQTNFHMNSHITYVIQVILALWSFYHSVKFRIDDLIIKENMMIAMTIKTKFTIFAIIMFLSHIHISDRFSL